MRGVDTLPHRSNDVDSSDCREVILGAPELLLKPQQASCELHILELEELRGRLEIKETLREIIDCVCSNKRVE
jgi:hypothetical protein